ncbi:MAG TPA: hypothetical protein PLB35_02750 [Myxococcota bacterium]|nr:hypothetical protein [Myxococcota bacterium]HOH76150.1 hypothetical protein [Myxococcota bacterium]
MRRLVLLTTIAVAAALAACGSSGDPIEEDTGINEVFQDSGSDVGIDTQTGDDAIIDSGTDNAWMDVHLPDVKEDIPEGPFYAKEEGDLVTVSDGRLTVVLNLADGTFNIGFTPGLDGIINGHSEAWVRSSEGVTRISSMNPAQRAAWQAMQTTDGLDDGVLIGMETVPSGSIGGMRTFIALHRNQPSVTIKVQLVLPVREGFFIEKLVPVVARGSEGAGMLLGPGTATARIVTGGHEIAYDANAEAINVTEAVETLNKPGYLSDNATLICTKAGKCLLAGFLNTVRGFGGVAVATDPVSAFAVGEDAALSLFEMRSTMVQGAMLSPSRVITSEVAYLDFTGEPGPALARFADAIATFNTLPVPRALPFMYSARVGQEGLTSDQVVAAIPDDSEGVTGFLVEQGWENAEKAPDAVKFPNHGGTGAMKWIADQAKAAGLVPGIALGPFVFKNDSAFAATHAEWLLEPGELAVVRLGIGNNSSILDLTSDDARAWAVAHVTTAAGDWGYRYVKIHGADIACMAKPGSTTGMTGVEGLRKFLEEVRAAVGADVFIELADGGMIGLGLVDAIGTADPQYKSWNAPASKVDNTLQMGAMTWARRAWLDGTVFNVVPGPAFDFSQDGTLTASGWIGPRLWAVTGGVPTIAEAQGIQGLLAELAGNPFGDAWAGDYADLRIPETWQAGYERDGVASFLAGFFRFEGNMDLYTLAPVNGARTRTLQLPQAEGNWLAIDPETAEMATVDGACMNPAGMELVLESGNSASRVLVLRKISAGGAPTFMAITPSIAGGDGLVSQLSSDAGSTTVTYDAFFRGDTTVVFAVPVANSPTVSVEGGTIIDQGVSDTACSDMKTAWIKFTPTADSVTVTASN